MNRFAQFWRTTTVRLTAIFIVIFVVFSVLLLAVISYQSSIRIQQQQQVEIEAEAGRLQELEMRQGLRSVALAVDTLARQPGPGVYFLGDASGQLLLGNVSDLPLEVLKTPGFYSFDYQRQPLFAAGEAPGEEGNGYAIVRSVVLDSGLILVVGRDVVERRGFTAIILQSFLFGVLGILVLSVITGALTAIRVLRRIDTITATSSMIMSGNLSERIPVTRRNDEFDALAANLNAMLDRIERLMQGLKEVTDNVAHDLKTPLTRLRNQAESALRLGAGDELRREALETTIVESDRLIRTFNALLMIARAEAGAPSASLVDTDLSAVAFDVAELYAPVAEEQNLVLLSEIEDGVKGKASRELIGQALVNLVENAIKYFEHQPGVEGRITLGLSTAKGHVHLVVADNGPGIPSEERERVVQRFVRLEKSRTEPGSGLGLSLVDAVAKLHGGTFRIEDNAPGVRAIIDLPTI